MTGIWTNTGEGWKVGSPQAFQDEASLHSLIARNPQLLPLAGSPRLTVLGSEIPLGNGYADILAVESTGRPAIIEVKLARNPQARRDVVSQVISYAAFLHGADVEGLERGPLRKALADEGYGSILEAVQAQDQEGAVDADSFVASMQEYLDQGNFRLVLVLDEVSAELARVVAYLDAMTVQSLTIDLMTLAVYDVNGAHVALPQRVSPDLGAAAPPASPGRERPARPRGVLSDGSDAFRATVEDAPDDARTKFDEFIAWAEHLAVLPNVRLFSYTGSSQHSLLPRILPDSVGLVTIYNYRQQPSITVWRSVFERLAPNSIEAVERVIAPVKIGQGNTVYNVTPQALKALTAAYQEASGT